MNQTSHDALLDATGQGISGTKRPLDAATSNKKNDKSKRLRVSRACDQCRAARERCDGTQPICSTCSHAERSCSYKEQPKKRGIQPNYIRTLELTLAWVFQSHPHIERELAGLLPDSQGVAHRTIAYKDVSSADAHHHVWRNGIVYRQIDQMLAGADIDNPQFTPGTQEVSISLPEEAAPYQSPPLSAPSDFGTLRLENDQHANVCGSSAAPQNKVAATAEMSDDPEDLLTLPANAWALLEHYFAFTQTWFPITEKHDVLRLMYMYPQDGLSKTEAAASEHAELWAIMAWSAFQMRSHDLCSDFELCQRNAKSLIPISAFEYGHVKALLILSLIELAQTSWSAAWLSIGTAVRILTHLVSDVGNSGAQYRGRTRHVFLAAYLLESAVALKLGALTHLRSADVRPVGLLIEDGLEEWAPWSDPSDNTVSNANKQPARSISTFNEIVKVSLNGKQMDDTGDRNVAEIVLELLANARPDGRRRHPSAVVADMVSASPSNSQRQADNQRRPSFAAAQLDHFDFDHWQNPQTGLLETTGEHQDRSFMSIPSMSAEAVPGQMTSYKPATGSTTKAWQDKDVMANNASGSGGIRRSDPTSTGPGADIFEELAILDRADANQTPSFLQNLGFGPDLDLAEFFGADYQPSDPTGKYGHLADVPQDYDNSGKEAG